MRRLFSLVALGLSLGHPAVVGAGPVELSGQFLIERDAVAALPGAPPVTDAVPGGTMTGAWVVDAGDLSVEALTGGLTPDAAPLASGFTVSSGGQDLYGEVMSHSRVTGRDAPAQGSAGDRVEIDALVPGTTPGDLDTMRLVLTGPADWFETTAPGTMPDLSRATATFEGQVLRGGQVVHERTGRALDRVTLRPIAATPSATEPAAAVDALIGV
ncbi:MAG: hypothetical protein MUF73_15430 [Rhodobacteraceae bacterium]|jgi:hypothetical protein|nr:hypothetical protein [Paracoccaceae bacterium]